jgi:pilus assembly protein CpaB
MESSGRLVILLIAGVIVAFAAIAIRNSMSNQPDPAAAAAASTRVIVAKHDVPLGVIVQMGVDIDWGEPPVDFPNQQEMLREANNVHIEDFNGAVTRRPLHAGEPVVQTALTKAGEGGFMSAVLEAGMRAVSIAVNQTSGNAGFISPGDHVDLIVTRRIKEGNVESIASNTFIYDVRVLAVDQMLDNPENKAILAKTVTVEVTPQQAEQVAVASEVGHISVALRSVTQAAKAAQTATPSAGETPAATEPEVAPVAEQPNPMVELYSEVPQSAERPRENKISPRMRVIRGDQTETVEFY